VLDVGVVFGAVECRSAVPRCNQPPRERQR
jgi:hypothetical protein